MKLNRKNPLLAASVLLTLTAPVAFAQNRYWDNNGATTAFGSSATGTWAAPTIASATQNWSSASNGTGALANYTTLITDTVHFGTDTSPNGVGGGTITVSGTVNALSMRFGNQSTSNITFTGGTINLGATANVSVGAGGTTLMTINSNITGAATSFTKNGNSLTLGGTNTYTGQTVITAGRLQFATQASLYNNNTVAGGWIASNFNVDSGATLAFNVGGANQFSTGNVTTLLTGLAVSSSATSGMNAGSILGFDTTNASGNTFTIADAINNTTGAGGGARGLTKLGTNTLVLGTANGFTGGTIISGGTLRLADINAVSGSTGVTFNTAANSVLQIGTDTAFVAANLLAISAGFSSSGTTNIVSDRATTGAGLAGVGLTHALGALSIGNTQMNITAGTNVTNGTAAISLTSVGMSSATTAQTTTFNPTTANMIVVGAVTGSASTGTHTLALGGTSAGNSIGGAISNGGRTTQNLSKTGASTWTLSASNTYNGTTSITGGSLRLGNGGTTGALTGTASITNDANLTVDRSNAFTQATDLNGKAISGTGSFTQAGGGTTTLSLANSYSGATTVTGGILSISSDGNLGTAPGAATANHLVLNGGTLQTTAAMTINANRGITLGASGGTINNAADGNTIYNGIIAGVGDLTVTHAGSSGGDLAVGTFAASNSYSGATIISNGHLSVNNLLNGSLDSSIGSSSSAAANLVLKNGATLHYQGAAAPAASTDRLFTLGIGDNELRSSGTGGITYSNTGNIAFVDSGARTLSLRAMTAGVTNTLDSIIGDGSGGATSVHKHGDGAWELTGANTYTGETKVNAGTLVLADNAAAGTSAGGITISGALAATLQINTGITTVDNITFSNTNAASRVNRVVPISTAYTTGTTGTLKSNFTPMVDLYADTTAEILASDLSTVATTLEMLFSDNSPATNDGIRRSDVFGTNGTSNDTYVIQLSTSVALAGDSVLGWLNGSNAWVRAGSSFFVNTAYNNALHFTVGNYGYDNTTSSVWAVVDHGGSFAAVPEPTSAFVGLLIGAGLLRRRRHAAVKG